MLCITEYISQMSVICLWILFVCSVVISYDICFFFKQKTAYEMRISDWSSDVCSSDLIDIGHARIVANAPVIIGNVPVPTLARDVEMPLDPADEAIEIQNRALRLALDRSEENTSELQSLMRIS